MKIGVLGTGAVGQTVGKGLVGLGHEVMMGSRTAGNDKAVAFAAEGGANASHGTFPEAAEFGELIVFAVNGGAFQEALAATGPERLAGKIVIDTVNTFDFSRGFATLGITGENSAGETLQRLAPGAKVVKALCTLNAAYMVNPKMPGGRLDMFMAGDDAAAKAEVGKILEAFGWRPVDLGGITSSRWLEAMAMTWLQACQAAGSYDLVFTTVKLS